MMKKLGLTLGLLSWISQAMAGPVGTADSVFIMPHTGLRPNFGQIDLSQTNAVKNQLGVSKGGTGLSNPTAHSLLLGEGSSNFSLLGPDASTTKVLTAGGSSADPSFQAPTVAVQAQGGASNQAITALMRANQVTSVGSSGYLLEAGNRNLIANPSFEASTFDSGWTVTTVTDAKETTIIVDGLNSAKLTYSSQTGGISQSVTPAVQTNSVNYEASCKVNTTFTTMEVCGLAGGTKQNCIAVPSSGTWQIVSANFVGPANGTTVGVQVDTTASGSGTVYVDDCYVGPARNLGSSSLNTPWATDSNFTTSSITGQGTITNMVAKSRRNGPDLMVHLTYTGGTAAASAWTIVIPSAYTINSAAFGTVSQKVGELKMLETASTQYPSVGEGPWAIFYDGSTTNTLYVAGHTSSNVYTKDNGNQGNGSIPNDVWFTIPITQYSDQSVYRPDATPASYYGTLTAGAAWASTSASFADITATSSLTSVSNRNFGTVTQSGGANGNPGIVFTPPRTGNYQVCFQGTLKASTTGIAGFRVYDGTSAWIPEIDLDVGASTTGIEVPITPCANFNVTSLSSITLRAQTKISTGTVTLCANSNAVCGLSIVELDAPMPAPYITGSVTSTTTGSERIARANMTCSSSSAVNSQSGTEFTSIGNVASGKCSVVIPSTAWSATSYDCAVTVNGTAVTSIVHPNINNKTSTGFDLYFASISTGSSTIAAASSITFDLVCMGPR